MKNILLTTLSVVAIVASLSVQAVSPKVVDLQTKWAEANYNLSGKAQTQAFETLIKEADAAKTMSSNAADILIWRGIIHSSYAGIKGGIGALSLAKAAKTDLETALKLDDKALDGSAYTTLGTLYHKVPGWPLGFGDDDKAAELLKTSIKLNPEGIDSNYFYGLFLMDKKDFKAAEQHLLKAQQAAPRPERPLADKGRQAEIRKALQQVRHQLSQKNNASITH
ncbi:MAG: hypothetical protein RQ732_04365 [Methylophaga sp.]|nr:hypothetical protein [Methylophaga sp.]